MERPIEPKPVIPPVYIPEGDELDLDIAWTGNTKWYNSATDTRSNGDWSLQINPAWNGVYLGRISGAYKGVGFYMVKNGSLALGPFQGSVACYRIEKGRGVCGTAWAKACTIVVPDVNAFPGHIACSSLSRSEIVVPIIAGNEIKGVLDIDSDKLNAFDETDKVCLEKAVIVLTEELYQFTTER